MFLQLSALNCSSPGLLSPPCSPHRAHVSSAQPDNANMPSVRCYQQRRPLPTDLILAFALAIHTKLTHVATSASRVVHRQLRRLPIRRLCQHDLLPLLFHPRATASLRPPPTDRRHNALLADQHPHSEALGKENIPMAHRDAPRRPLRHPLLFGGRCS